MITLKTPDILKGFIKDKNIEKSVDYVRMYSSFINNLHKIAYSVDMEMLFEEVMFFASSFMEESKIKNLVLTEEGKEELKELYRVYFFTVKEILTKIDVLDEIKGDLYVVRGNDSFFTVEGFVREEVDPIVEETVEETTNEPQQEDIIPAEVEEKKED